MIRTLACCVLLCLSACFSMVAADEGNLTGRWVITADLKGTTRYLRLQLDQKGDKISGKFAGDMDLEGTLGGGKLHFIAKDKEGGSDEITATVEAGKFSGM